MSKYDNTKFYWLQLKEDFFEDDAIQWLEEQEPNGRDYAYFYLKLCLKSLKTNGILIRQVGKVLIPYDNRKLAELTNIDFDTVVIAMELLKKIGLIEILENGEIYIKQLENLIGSQSFGAFKKQQQRLVGRQMSANRPPEIDIEIELDKEIDKEEEIYKEEEKNIFDYYQEKIGNLNPSQYEIVNKWLEIYSYEKIKNAIDIAIENNAKNFNYIKSVLINGNFKPKSKKESSEPSWMNKEITHEEVSDMELKELEKEFEIFN